MTHNILITLSPDELRTLLREEVSSLLEAVPTPEPATTNTAADELLSRTETARLLRVSLPTLREYERRGMLMPKRIGRRVLYRRGDVSAALDAGRVGR